MSLRSSIDLGTNTCLLLIGKLEGSKVKEVVADESTIVRLGQGVDRDRKLSTEAMERTLACLKDYAGKVRAAGLDPASTFAVATSQARDAANGSEFFDRVREETGFRFQTISGAEEARLTFLGGLLPGMDPKSCAVIDIGGGSTEFMAQKGGQSLDIGSVRFTERYLKSDPVTDEEFWACQESVDSELESLSGWRSVLAPQTRLVAVAGTATTLAAWHLKLEKFDREKIDGAVLTRGDIHRLVEELKWRSIEERRQLPGVEAGRADVLLAGALILWRALETLGFADVHISTRGLRYGVVQEFVG